MNKKQKQKKKTLKKLSLQGKFSGRDGREKGAEKEGEWITSVHSHFVCEKLWRRRAMKQIKKKEGKQQQTKKRLNHAGTPVASMEFLLFSTCRLLLIDDLQNYCLGACNGANRRCQVRCQAGRAHAKDWARP